MKNVTVVGLGKIGLPLAAIFANCGHFHVYGADINKLVVDQVNQGISHVNNEPGLDELVAKAHQKKSLEATINTAEAVSKSDIVVVIVPVLTRENGQINYQYIDSAVEEIAKGIKMGTLVTFETTLPAGDTRNRFGKTIEKISGLTMGKDFFLSYSPERVYSNRIIKDLSSYPKVVSGYNKRSLELATDFYKKGLNCEILQVSTLESAEFTKVAECVYRDVNIALANELAIYANNLDINIMEVIKAANSEPYSNIHLPGVGVGGHCIPVYPYFFINNGMHEGLTTLSRKINDSMAEYAVELIEEIIGSLKDKTILILGLSFRGNVKEPTKSSTLLLIEALKERETTVCVDDPLFNPDEISKYGVIPFSNQLADQIDAIILQAYHDEYQKIDFSVFENCSLILDGRNVLNQREIENLGMKYLGIGIK
ncbi:nucleotide sugar dehydrogenase [Neobacillus vireti]|uniref:nucleotide sugar dehydrogenase n=1 Tax=Neobacillus vireti TaxID=220686 RepID=UPI002FFF4258